MADNSKKKAQPKKAAPVKKTSPKAAVKKQQEKAAAKPAQAKKPAKPKAVDKTEADVKIDMLDKDSVIEWASVEAEKLLTNVPDKIELNIDVKSGKSWLRKLLSKLRK